MMEIYVADVGDGLCGGICTIFGNIVQIDCGGWDSKVAFDGFIRIFNYYRSPEVFVLSHFHADHYNGLVHAYYDSYNKHNPFMIKEVYYPRIPEFPERKRFLLYLFTINLVVLGSETGVMEYDLLSIITKLNNGVHPYRFPRFKGQIIKIGSSIFEVLWPPDVISANKVLNKVKRALDDFDKALEEDEETRKMYDYVEREGIFEDYLLDKKEISEFERSKESHIIKKCKRRRLPEAVKKANESLREAANHFSLAFFEDNRLLFLGDVEEFGIQQIIDDLKLKGRRDFFVLVTPHHGTHWHKSLEQIKCIYSLTSNGSKFCSKFKPEYKRIARYSLATSVNGDLMMPGKWIHII